MPLLHVPVPVKFGPDGEAALDKYVYEQVESLVQSHKELHETKVIQWRDWYFGRPEQETRSFPWANAANLVVQLIGTHVDMLKARVLSSIYEVMPLVVAGLIGEWKPEEQGEEQRQAIEDYMNYVGLEPKELDLYRVESAFYTDVFRFGSGVIKYPWETDIESEVVGSETAEPVTREFVKYDGPRPEKLPLEKFAITPTANTLESAEFKYHKRTLTRMQLEERKFRGIYDKNLVDVVLNQPDRYGADQVTKDKQEGTGVQSTTGYDQREYDLYECWFPYWHNGNRYRLIYTYHRRTKTKLKAIFNFYPDNMEPFEMGRLGYDGDGAYGYGFCEMLHHYQEEMSTVHNQDIDNATLANTSVLRLDPSLKLDSQFSIYPMATLPFREGEVEVFQLGRANNDSIQRQQLILQLAKDRSGVDTGMEGMGGGVTNPKKGVYSAQGTFAVLQAGNRRVNLNTTDARYAHLRLCRNILLQYAHFGIGERVKLFGQQAEFLTKALESVKSKRIALPIRAANASVNRELEKQNDMLLNGVMRQHYASVSQILQTLPQAPPYLQQYLMNVIKASDSLMRHILRNFGHDDVSRLLPEAITKEMEANVTGRTNQGNAGQTTSNNSVLQAPGQPQGGSNQLVAGTGGSQSPQLPTGNSGQLM